MTKRVSVINKYLFLKDHSECQFEKKKALEETDSGTDELDLTIEESPPIGEEIGNRAVVGKKVLP